MKALLLLLLACTSTLLVSLPLRAQELEAKPDDPAFAKFQPLKAPRPGKLLLEKGDRLAICGDSITEQKMYSRAMETYLTVCVPELEVTVRQYGWGGETAPGFLARITNDCLRFKPTIATTCYGMNDHRYGAYRPEIGDTYRKASTQIVRAFKAAGARVVHGSPGCVGLNKNWDAESVEVKNLNLVTLRNLGIELAAQEQVAFADVFWPMLQAGVEGRKRYGPGYAIAGKDGVHPDWAGSFVMAYAFLKGLGLGGEIGTLTVNLANHTATASAGHRILSAKPGELTLESAKYPFCVSGDPARDNNIRSATTLVPFHEELNRFQLVGTGGTGRYKVTWGTESKSFSAEQLARGINLAQEFEKTPFAEAFARVDAAVARKQDYETRQIKTLFHGPEAALDLPAVAELTEKTRAPLALAIRKAFTPVTHTLSITAE
ncbi:MAG: hypothetical protein RJA22_1187 [Verrucomicrobiota bacterium]